MTYNELIRTDKTPFNTKYMYKNTQLNLSFMYIYTQRIRANMLTHNVKSEVTCIHTHIYIKQGLGGVDALVDPNKSLPLCKTHK